MKNGLFKLGWTDLGNGLIVAMAAPFILNLLTVLGAVITAPGFDVFSVDYGTLVRSLLNTSIVVSYSAFLGYITKNLLTTNDGQFLGIK